MYLEPVTESEILEITSNFKNKKSKGYDNLSMSIVKFIIPTILQPLKHIFNMSLETGIFPDYLKIAKIIPIHKSTEFNNYRPISILPQFSKILEKLMYKRVASFLEKHQILSDSQFGFRKKNSTAHAVTELIELISDSLENKEIPLQSYTLLHETF